MDEVLFDNLMIDSTSKPQTAQTLDTELPSDLDHQILVGEEEEDALPVLI